MFTIVFETRCNFFIVLPIRLKICILMFLFIFCKAKCECSSASDLHQKACTKRQDLDYSKHSSSFKCQHHMTLEHSKDSSTTSSHHRNHLWLGLWFLHQQRKKSVLMKIYIQALKSLSSSSNWPLRSLNGCPGSLIPSFWDLSKIDCRSSW